jgi:putative transposase
VLTRTHLVGVLEEARPEQEDRPAVHDDLVDRQFIAEFADELSLTDITEHRTDEGTLYLCAIKDVWSNRIVGYSIDSRMKASLAVSALYNAVAQRGSMGTIVHSDRGSQFRSGSLVHTLSCTRLRGSMGRVGACGDNAAMESFFALVQKNVLDRQRWSTREQRRLAIVTWIEKTYHRKRRQRRLGNLTPIEFETINQTAHAVWTTQPRQSTELGAVPLSPSWAAIGACDGAHLEPVRAYAPNAWNSLFRAMLPTVSISANAHGGVPLQRVVLLGRPRVVARFVSGQARTVAHSRR